MSTRRKREDSVFRAMAGTQRPLNRLCSGADLHSPPSLHRLILNTDRDCPHLGIRLSLAFETLSNQNPQFKGGDVSQRLVLLQCNVKTRTRPLY